MSVNIDEIIKKISKTVASHRLKNEGEYARWLWQNEEGTRDLGLNAYGCADATNILYTIGEFPNVSQTRKNFINALQSGQLFGGEIDSRYTDDYRNDYASNHSTGKRIDMSAAARKEMADWDKYTRATSGNATKEGIVPVTMYCGNTTKTYFFDKNCDIAEGKRRGEEYINGIERYNRMMEAYCVRIPQDEINLESIYDCKILSQDNNTGIYGVKEEVMQ